MNIARRLIRNFRYTLNPPHNLHDVPGLLGIIMLFLLIAVLALTVFESPDSRSFASTPFQGSPQSEFLSNEVLVRLKKTADAKIKKGESPGEIEIASIASINKTNKVEKFEKIFRKHKGNSTDEPALRWYKIKLPGKGVDIKGSFNKKTQKLASNNPKSQGLKKIMNELLSDPNVEAIEPNFVVKTSLVPDDPYYSSSDSWGQSHEDLYGLYTIEAATAWDTTTGSPSIVVADIDTGVDRNHEDLSGQMWVNTSENPNNGLDDDGNGYVDDYYGWDWANSDNDPMDDHGHGTHTAGTVAAVGNNTIGVVGVNWASKIMALKFLSADGSGYLSDGIAALQYAADMGAKVSSNSWGCVCNTSAMDDAVKYQHDRGMVVVAAAGNSNADALDHSPASADHAIAVGAADQSDAKASFSNYGQKIDVTAPGVDILSLKAAVSPLCDDFRTVGTKYCRVSGTSMATPHVAGLAALLWANNPSLTNEEIRQVIRLGADDLGDSGKDQLFGYGRINAATSMALSTNSHLRPFITSPSSRSKIVSSSFNVTGGVSGSNFANYKVEAGTGRNPSTWTSLGESSTQVNSGTLVTFDTNLLSDGDYIFRITATATDGKIYQFQTHDVSIENVPEDTQPPLAPKNLTLKIVSKSRVDLTWDASTDNVGVAGYRIYRNNSLLKTQTSRTYSDTTIKRGSKYTFYIKSYDAAGNISSRSNLVSVEISEQKLADINDDGDINIRDLSLLLSRWKQSNADSDLNNDGRVDIRDLSILLSRWGT